MDFYTEDANFFLDVAPAFVASLPPAPPRDEVPNSVKKQPLEDIRMLARNNANVELRFEIGELLATFTKERANQDLSFDDHRHVAEALEDILYLLEDLVDDSIISKDTIQLTGKFRKLECLRQYLIACKLPSSLNRPPQVPNDFRRWILYFEPGKNRTEAAQYRATARSAKEFNSTMGRIFQSTRASVESRPTQVFQEDRNEVGISLEDDKRDLTEYARLSSVIKAMVKVILEMSKACQASHSSFIYLSGFYEAEREVRIETIMTVCESGRSEKWHPVHWVGSSIHANRLRPQQTSTTTICGRLRQIRKAKKRLCIKVCPDGSWKEVVTDHRMNAYTEPPGMVLQDVLIPRQNQRDAKTVAPPLTKPDRLDLGIRIARSFLCLIGSPLLQCRWKSESMFVSRGTDASHDEDRQTKAYIQNDPLTEAVTPESKKHNMVELGALLWELFFAQKVNILEQDEESDDEDEIPSLSLYNALNREEIASREKCVEVECLDIIANCLDAYDKVDELDDSELRTDLYDKIVKPLKEYLQSYNSPRSNKRVASPSPIPFFQQSHQVGYSLPIANKNLSSQLNGREVYERNARISQHVDDLEEQQEKYNNHSSRLLSAQICSRATERATDWLNDFKAILIRTIGQEGGRSVRLAILDTGFKPDPTVNPRFSVQMRKRWRDFAGVSQGPVDEDKGQHGTRIVNLLHDILPKFEIFVGRVTIDKNGLADAKDNIAAAITYAADPDKWNADIISMSFGSTTPSKVVIDAIKDAERKRDDAILFFAAAANDGANLGEMFPASFTSVISVRGTWEDGGFMSKYNPDPQPSNQGTALFGTLADSVPCGAPYEDANTMSGCSVATPILASTAAFFIEFANSQAQARNLSHQERDVLGRLKTRAGMLHLFKRIASQREAANNRLYVAPQLLFKAGLSEEDCLIHIRSSCLEIPKRE
ncbi:subtilisin-like protein [Zopfia rhizophila CBS 207.26]|uniref:Subtilisin-like protein n=1 Tax=Zopfia rhizophila CBS 207.26 TaxID=1314779 RepID=A0A6A6EKK1_9PEZI|nr:subtilisin-like protein [Zopfia rhizophila CBS 207.26]